MYELKTENAILCMDTRVRKDKINKVLLFYFVHVHIQKWMNCFIRPSMN